MIKSPDRSAVAVLTGTSSYHAALIAFLLTTLLMTVPLLLPSLTFIRGGRYIQQLLENLTLPLMFGLPVIAGALAASFFTHELCRETHTLLLISGLSDAHIVRGYLLRVLRQLGMLWGVGAGFLIPIWISLYSWHLTGDTVCFIVLECLGIFRLLYVATTSAFVAGMASVMASGMLLAVLIAFAISLRVPRTSAAVALTVAVMLPAGYLSSLALQFISQTFMSDVSSLTLSYFLASALMLSFALIALTISAGTYRLLPRLLRRPPML